MNSLRKTSFAASLAALFALIAALAIAAVPAAADRQQATATAVKNVTVGDNFYSPSSLSIKRNDSVRFRWNGTSRRHNVTVRTGPVGFSSATRRGSYGYTQKFTRKGTYKLYCTLHPNTMKATVSVR
ncbi:MAG: cupredoxin domain-containing protein [Thermoleophilaceae bacterium]|nr:cupredoxin domain-containing protein [Thermoleophilaceae bacterium]